MSHLRAELLGHGIAGITVVGTLALLVLRPEAGIVVAAMVAFVCLALLAGGRLSTLGVGCIVLFAGLASWDQLSIGGVNPRFLVLLIGVVMLVLSGSMRQLSAIPWWIHAFAISAIVVTILALIFPVPPEFLNLRYETSAAGYALGNRTGPLPALLYLVANVYVVPLGVGLAIAAAPQSVRWIVGAFVGGVAWSSIAGYLGFIGYPWLSDLFGEPVPAGIRALGYSIHPLHLATACVMAIGLAVWMSSHSESGAVYRWLGRGSVIAILLGTYASGSRGGNVSAVLVLGLCVLFIPSIRRRWHVVVGLVIVGISLVVLFVPAFGESVLRTTRVYGGETSDASDLGRGELFMQALHDFAQSPLFGIGTRYMAEAHVLYAGILASGGVILLVGYILFNLGSMRAAWRMDAGHRPLARAVLATLVGSLAYWTVGDEFTVPEVQFLYGVLFGLILLSTERATHAEIDRFEDPAPHGPAVSSRT